jgi:hypothetical protein
VQNTNMIIDIGAAQPRHQRRGVSNWKSIGAADIVRGEAAGPDIRAVLPWRAWRSTHASTTDKPRACPAQLLVEGMAGIPTQPTGVLKALGLPAKVLRKAVTMTPLYAARQLFRDSIAAPILTGADFTPMLGALAADRRAPRTRWPRAASSAGRS